MVAVNPSILRPNPAKAWARREVRRSLLAQRSGAGHRVPASKEADQQ